ncbi:MAG TPA: hypothetical protein VMB24_01190 [Dehalococcoidales bacterium]|nr:hypothetical protein [Dehalococcoidales bacterium]
MKILKIIAWTGLGFFVVGIILAARIGVQLVNHNPTFGIVGWWLIILPIDLAGLLLMYIGGLISHPKCFWIACLAAGVIHIAASLPPQWGDFVRRITNEGAQGFFTNLLIPPVSLGLVAIILGVILLLLDRTKQKKRKASI